jgi:hypothetical protein
MLKFHLSLDFRRRQYLQEHLKLFDQVNRNQDPTRAQYFEQWEHGNPMTPRR